MTGASLCLIATVAFGSTVRDQSVACVATTDGVSALARPPGCWGFAIPEYPVSMTTLVSVETIASLCLVIGHSATRADRTRRRQGDTRLPAPARLRQEVVDEERRTRLSYLHLDSPSPIISQASLSFETAVWAHAEFRATRWSFHQARHVVALQPGGQSVRSRLSQEDDYHADTTNRGAR